MTLSEVPFEEYKGALSVTISGVADQAIGLGMI